MPPLRWLRAEPASTASGLVTLRQKLLLVMALLTFYASTLALLWSPAEGLPPSQSLAVFVLGTVLAAAVLGLRRTWPQSAAYLYTVASLALYALAFATFGEPAILALCVLPVVVSGPLLGLGGTLLNGTLAAGLLLYLNTGPEPSKAISLYLVLLGAAAAISLVMLQAFTWMDHWERELVHQQQTLIGQLRERQGELNRTLKALDEAYASLKRSNDELIVARQEAEEARSLKEQFVANVSHELRTPLNLIVGFAEMMYLAPETYEGVGWTTDLVSDLKELYRASRHLQSLINDVLDLSRIDASRLPMFRELQDIRPIIADAVETIAPLLRQRGLSYALQIPDDLPQLFVDRTRIRQVLLNLLNNAVRFTDRGGITIRVTRQNDAVVVGVQDTGVGIPEQQIGRLFEDFSQGDAGLRSRVGAGLGLAISRRFVQLHGGRMWVESQVGVGSTFYFSLPLPGAAPQTTTLQRTASRQRADLSQAPIVVVDPDPSIAEMLGRYLGDRPTLAAESPAAAEDLIESAHPLAIVVNQPPEASAQGWLGPLGPLSQLYDVPILRCSISSHTWLRQETGFDDVLTKPISREALLQTLQRHCPRAASILVVDDDPGFVSLVARMLGGAPGVREILMAYNGPQALRLVQEKTPELVLLDLLMPEMDGLEVLRLLRQKEEERKTVVIAVTATSYAEEVMLRRGQHVTLFQPQGLSPGTVTELLRATLQWVRPNYVPARARLRA
jgi:signal transduction histidine kinase/DNA-binding response OmpR family regulator